MGAIAQKTNQPTIIFTPDCYDFEFSTLDYCGTPLSRQIDSCASKYSAQAKAKSPVPSPNIVAT